MQTAEQLKALVREKYGEIAQQEGAQDCCGMSGCAPTDYTVFAEDYRQLAGYNADADLALGCGLPTEFAHIRPGQTVLDLGSGAGNDCFVARAQTGEFGRVIGVDMTPAMVEKARQNAHKLGFANVEFHLGEIEALPLPDNTVDVVVSNCVLNLVPNKAGAFAETFRVLRPGGHFSISDIVLRGQLPTGLQEAAEMYAGCVSGAIEQEEYLGLARAAGFTNLRLQKERVIQLPDQMLTKYLSADDIAHFRSGTTGIVSITLYGEKPAAACSGPGCC